MKSFPYIIDKTKESKEAYRLQVAAFQLFHLQVKADRILAGHCYTAAEKIKKTRLERAEREHPNKGTPIELFDKEGLEVFCYEIGGDGRKARDELLKEGERIGLWTFIPHPKGYAKKARKEALRPNLVFLNDWPLEEPVELPLSPKRISNFSKKIAAEENAKRESEKFTRAQATLLLAHYDAAEKYAFPIVAELEKLGEELTRRGFRTRKGKLYVFRKEEDKNESDIRKRIKGFVSEKALRETTGVIESPVWSKEAFGLRVYTPTNNTARWIREEITFAGERMGTYDFSSLHPNLLYLILLNEDENPPDFLTGKSHRKVAILLGLNPDNSDELKHAKKVNLTYYNSDRRDFDKWLLVKKGKEPKESEHLLRFHRLMKSDFPHFILALDRLNKKYRFGGKTHANLSRLTFFRETQLMGEISRELTKAGIPHDPIHDAFFIPESKGAQAIAIMNAVATRKGLKTTASKSKTVKEEYELD